MHSAASDGDVDLLRDRLTRFGESEYSVSFQGTPLMIACSKGRLNVVQYLIEERGLNLDGSSAKLLSPLASAAEIGRLEIVRYLVESGANVNHLSGELGRSALMMAAWRGHANVCDYLLGRPGSLVYLEDAFEMTAQSLTLKGWKVNETVVGLFRALYSISFFVWVMKKIGICKDVRNLIAKKAWAERLDPKWRRRTVKVARRKRK